MPDFLTTNLGSVIQLHAETDAAIQWAVDNLGMDSDLQPVVTVEAAYFLDIGYALLEAGLTLQDTATGQLAQLPEVAHVTLPQRRPDLRDLECASADGPLELPKRR